MDNVETKIVGLRLLDGSEVIATCKEAFGDKKEYCKMLRVVIHQNGQATMIPYIDLNSFDEFVPIKTEHVIVTYTPAGTMLEQYKRFEELMQKQRSKIIMPEKKIIT